MGSRPATLQRNTVRREEILKIEAPTPQPHRAPAWLVPVPLVAAMLVQTALGIVWLDNRLAPIAVLLDHEKEHDGRIAELARRVEAVDDECRYYERKSKR
jgi:hypothetical protein